MERIGIDTLHFSWQHTRGTGTLEGVRSTSSAMRNTGGGKMTKAEARRASAFAVRKETRDNKIGIYRILRFFFTAHAPPVRDSRLSPAYRAMPASPVLPDLTEVLESVAVPVPLEPEPELPEPLVPVSFL